jgi:pyridoxal 5'-phosphate synthase pdxT subunit
LKDKIKIGILSIQGDIEENFNACKDALKQLNIEGEVTNVKDYNEILDLDGLIVPGGESTVISTLLSLNQANWKLLKERINEGLSVMGTCAGLILLSKRSYDKRIGETKQKLLEILDITVERNAFGRQHESFETELEIPLIGEKPFKGVFIRGPVIKETGKDVKTLAKYDNEIVAVQQNNIIGTSFHPELTEDSRLHVHFIKTILKNKEPKNIR